MKEESADTFRARLPDYLAVFGVGLAVAAGIGVALAAMFGGAVLVVVGWTLVVVGVGALLFGGMSGGGFDRMSSGEHGIHYGKHHDAGMDDVGAEIARVEDLKDRLAAGLRPAQNPAAFWQVVGGLAYVAIGLGLVALG